MLDQSRPVLRVLDKLTWESAIDWFLGVPLQIALILASAWIIRWLIHRAIDRLVDSLVARKSAGDTTTMGSVEAVPTAQLPLIKRYRRKAGRAISQSGLVATQRQRARVETLGSVMRSIASVVVWGIAVLMVGSTLGLNMAPVLASAGVGGVALGFGAQSLVKDFLSGVFMILEDQYGVGDFIDTGDVQGTVEEVTLRVTRLRDLEGVVWYVRNGEIIRIANRSQGWNTASIDIPVSPKVSPERVIAILGKVAEDMYADPAWRGRLLAEPDVAGVESITGSALTIRVFAKCATNKHWAVQREFRERAVTALEAAGIRGPLLAVPAPAPPTGPQPSSPPHP
ncbi:mechanosensitive ion channel family protein [Mobilicoccus massiliensis]|uniref:mechanosensitive ion channel family protein n=1 Tax=Mobilicoccus massiliensis TaxID=1522310 RepID=UPI0006947844|nr:mechanosensitive ion channel family protein [Mobilicoccus massiliensis]